jgi:hypothetical protein
MLNAENDCGNDRLRFITEVGMPLAVKSAAESVHEMVEAWKASGAVDEQDLVAMSEVHTTLGLLLSVIMARRLAANAR